jgi:hypothetical protein
VTGERGGPAVRPIDMRAHRYALAALLVAALAAGGCAGRSPSAAPSPEAPSPGLPTAASPSPGAPSPGGPSPPVAASTPPPRPAPTTKGTPMPPPPSEIQNPLPGPERRLTGTVSRSGGCVVLVVGERRWALVGAAAAGLTSGARMRVTGAMAAVPAGCDADMAVAVTRAEPA